MKISFLPVNLQKDEIARQSAEKIRLEEERKQAEADRKDREVQNFIPIAHPQPPLPTRTI